MSTQVMLDAITLPNSFKWVDEFNWSEIKAQQDYTVTGALIVQESQALVGRPITLSGDARTAWTNRNVVVALLAKAALLAQIMTLTWTDGRTFNVQFRRNNGDPIEATPVGHIIDPPDTHKYIITLKLQEVEI